MTKIFVKDGNRVVVADDATLADWPGYIEEVPVPVDSDYALTRLEDEVKAARDSLLEATEKDWMNSLTDKFTNQWTDAQWFADPSSQRLALYRKTLNEVENQADYPTIITWPASPLNLEAGLLQYEFAGYYDSDVSISSDAIATEVTDISGFSTTQNTRVWEGYFLADSDDDYTFSTTGVDDFFAIYVGATASTGYSLDKTAHYADLLNADSDTTVKTLKANVYYPVRIVLSNNNGASFATLVATKAGGKTISTFTDYWYRDAT